MLGRNIGKTTHSSFFQMPLLKYCSITITKRMKAMNGVSGVRQRKWLCDHGAFGSPPKSLPCWHHDLVVALQRHTCTTRASCSLSWDSNLVSSSAAVVTLAWTITKNTNHIYNFEVPWASTHTSSLSKTQIEHKKYSPYYIKRHYCVYSSSIKASVFSRCS